MLLCSTYPLHFYNEDRWQEVNLKPEEIEGGYRLETPFYKFEFTKFPFKISFNNQWVRSLDRPDTNFVSVVDKGIEIKDIFENMDMLIRIFPESVGIFLKFKEGKYELNWKNQDGDFKQEYNYDIPMTVKSGHFGKNAELSYPEKKVEGTEEFRKYTKSDHFEDLPNLEIYYVH